MTKAHAYLRVSGKGQVEGDGFTRQLKAIREYAAAHDIKIVNVYREEGVSGTKDSADLMATDPTRILVRQMMGAVAQYEKAQIVLKLRGARVRKRAKEGRCEGRKPYGYYEGEAAPLGRIKALRAEGLGFDRVAAKLNEEGVPTRTGKPWHGVVVNRILTGKR